MEEQQNIQTQQAKDKKGLLKKIGAWFASPDGMQTLRFISAIAAVIAVGVICALLGIYMDKDNFLPKERNYALIGACAVELALVFIIAKFFSMQKKLKKSETKGCIDPFTAAFMLGLNSYFLPDFVMGSYFPKSNVLYILLGILLCWLLYLIGAVIFPKPHAWFCGVNVIFAIYALAQYYVTEFRGNPVQFADLANIKSVSEINGMYSLFLDGNVMFVLCDLILIFAVTVTTKVRKIKIRSRIISGVAVIAGCFVFVYGGRFAYDLGIKNRYIRLNFSGAENADTYRCVGYDLMFCFDGMFNRVTKPDGYSTQKAEDIITQYEVQKADKKPTIIAIMNESFADFEHIAQFKTNKDYLPNYHKLQEESISGYVSVSAYGGYSCNSEYEFLTGNTLGFLPSGSAVFTQYLNDKQNGLVSWLNELGYTTQAISPCSEGLWDIGNAYEQLQFKDRIYNCQDRMSDIQYFNGNITDETIFRYIEEQYERHAGSPYFVWTATMQNHAPYDDLSSVPSEITFEDYNNPAAQEYLNLIYQSDKALGELIDYFRNKDEEVIIVMFGDHYPHIIDFTEYLYGKDVALLSTEDYSRLRQTPFLIWSNKGVEAEKIDDISLNYLSNEVMEAAGLPKSRYQQELDRLKRADIVHKNFSNRLEQSVKEQDTAQRKLFNARREYTDRFKPCPFRVEAVDNDEFEAEQKLLEESELPKYREKIKAARESAMEQFQNDFLAKLKSSIDQVQDQVKNLNRALRQAQFGTDSYQFRVERNPDYAEYYDMIMDPELMEGDVGLFAQPFQDKYGQLIEKLFSQITTADDTQLNARKQSELQENIQRYTDFRTYLKFDLETTDQNGTRQMLSQTLNTKSGGETQTPFYIAVLASFAQLYRVNDTSSFGNTVRLAVFDEAFNKMDSDRIIESVRLLRKMGLQAIICTPPDKVSDIMPIADRTLLVNKDKYRMHILPFGKEIVQ